MRLSFSSKLATAAIGSYLVLVQIAMPLLSPLRALGTLEPGEIRNLLLPPLLLITVLIFGGRRVLRVRSLFHLALALAFLQAALIGIPNLLDPEQQRNYFSHLFQIASAYCLLNIGWLSKDMFGHAFWRGFAVAALIATVISTFFTLSALGRGELGRLYTPAYTLIFVTAYSVLYSKSVSSVSILALIVSNKRGPILSAIVLFLQYYFSRLVVIGRRKRGWALFSVARGIFLFFLAAIVTTMLVRWALLSENQDHAIGRAIVITYNRIVDVAEFGSSERSLDDISSGRMEEVDTAFNSISGLGFIFGEGAGWTINLPDGKSVQNVHFSPLSVMVVYGAPFALVLYCFLYSLTFRATFRLSDHLSTTERIAPLYLSGALFHSFFAYSLFIDWLVFFFAGVLLRSLRENRLPNSSRTP